MTSFRPKILALVVFGGAACAASPAMRAVERGDQAALRAEIAARERTGRFSNRDAASLAKAVAERDLRAAFGADAVDRVRDARSCARELDDALAVRMATHDAAGAQAALARIESGALDLDDARAYADDAQSGWRAIATRVLVRRSDGGARQRALVDPEPLVRRQAARAARDAKDEADVDALLEAARVDPEPIVRTEAVRAIAAMPATTNGGTPIVNALRDLWTSGDEGLREDIALAWSGDALWGAGGRDALRQVIGADHGAPAIEAAAAVLRRCDADPEVTQLAVSQLARAMEAGPVATRLQALAQAPLDRADLAASVRVATAEEDLHVRVAALGRFAEKKDARAIAELELLAVAGSPVAGRARLALAISGDRRIQGWVEQDLTDQRAELRLAAATGLAAMGVAARGALLLADEKPGVRLRAACTMMMAARRP